MNRERARRLAPAGIVIPFGAKEPAERREAIKAVARAAAALRKLDPFSPAPYLMLRGLRWGELRAALNKQDMTLLEGPPTELRQHIKRLAIEGQVERTAGGRGKFHVPARAAAAGWICRSSRWMPARAWAATIPALPSPFAVN